MTIEIKYTLKFLQDKKIILYPTDTVWGLGCDATDEIAIQKIFKIKQRDASKSLVILVDSLTMLKQYVDEVPLKVKEVLKDATKPTTIIYNNPKGLATNLIAEDNTVAIRIVQHEFCQNLIRQFGKPIVSTSANMSGKVTPMSFKEIETAILNDVDYVVNLQQNKKATQASRIIKILEYGELQILRD